jgi:hypothetical protein
VHGLLDALVPAAPKPQGRAPLLLPVLMLRCTAWTHTVGPHQALLDNVRHSRQQNELDGSWALDPAHTATIEYAPSRWAVCRLLSAGRVGLLLAVTAPLRNAIATTSDWPCAHRRAYSIQLYAQ